MSCMSSDTGKLQVPCSETSARTRGAFSSSFLLDLVSERLHCPAVDVSLLYP
uniref:Uncharacterized protein n=1 Tax=Arundo donax TaxID=35708 RepID=A0A0A9AEL3_ARUDO